MRPTPSIVCYICVLACAGYLVGCDSVEPDAPPVLVVEAFLHTGHNLPSIRLSRAFDLASEEYGGPSAAVSDADVVLEVDGEATVYTASGTEPGRYDPTESEDFVLAEGSKFCLEAVWRGQSVVAEGTLPPRIRLDSVRIDVPESAVEAVLLDSLRLDTLGVDSETGYLYTVEATLWWPSTANDADTVDWIQTQLKPFTEFSSVVVDFFLLPEQVFEERRAHHAGAGQRTWTGVYAIPVEEESDAIPGHRIRVAVVRGRQEYARYAATRDAPGRREPVTNVRGGLGIVAGVSVDTLTVEIEAGRTGAVTVRGRG